jgi:hypothetical protein
MCRPDWLKWEGQLGEGQERWRQKLFAGGISTHTLASDYCVVVVAVPPKDEGKRIQIQDVDLFELPVFWQQL